MSAQPLDLSQLKVLPLSQRESLTRTDEILIEPDAPLKPCTAQNASAISECAQKIMAARAKGATVMLIYGAHLLRNGAAKLLERMMSAGWLTHLATNGAGTIHDWEYAWLGASTESVEKNVATGTFGSWHETATNIHLALLSGALDGLGYGRSLGRFIDEDGATIPAAQELAAAIAAAPRHPLTSARADLLRTMIEQQWPAGPIRVSHRWKHASILAQAYRHGVPITVHPGVGYDIISNHPVFCGAAIGRGESSISSSSAVQYKTSTAASFSRSARRSWARKCSRKRSVASIISGYKPGETSSAATPFTWSTFRTAAGGTGPPASPQKPTPPTTSVSARVSRGWAGCSNICSATTRPSSSIFTAG